LALLLSTATAKAQTAPQSEPAKLKVFVPAGAVLHVAFGAADLDGPAQ